jgi:molecular chaperone GrpE
MNEVENPNVEETKENLEETPETTDNMTAETSQSVTENEHGSDRNGKEKGKSFFGKKNDKLKEENEKLTAKVEELEKAKVELNERFLRLFSEFDNYKKRTAKERLELIETASEKVIMELLPIIDDFERAIAANQNVTDLQSVKDGFDLIYQKLLKVLTRFSVEEIPAKGEKFDTDLHEAVAHFPAQNEEDKDKVIDVTEKGYKMKDKVIRYSKVVVAN